MKPLKRHLAWSLVGAVALAAGCKGERTEDLIGSAKSYMLKHDNKAATIELKRALQGQPDSPEARFLLGSTLLDAGEVTAAEVELRKAMTLGHPPASVVPVLVKAMVAKGQYQPVTVEFGQTEFPDKTATAEVKTSLALAYARLGKGKQARETLDAALRADPGLPAAVLMRARFRAEAGDPDGALAMLDSIIAKTGGDADAWQLRGDLLYAAKGDAAGALAAHRKALEFRDDLVLSQASILSILFAQKNLDEAKRQLEKLKATAPTRLETKYFEAELALYTGDFKTARETAQMLLKAAPDNARVLQLAGVIELQGGSPLQARTHLSKSLQVAPGNAETRRLLVQALLRSSQPEKALETLAPLLQAAKPDAQTLGLAAEASLHSGDVNAAKNYYERAAKADPADRRSSTALALSRLSSGDPLAGMSQLQDIAASDKGSAADLALIAAHLQRNEIDAALKAIEGLERKTPKLPLAANLRGRIQLMQSDLPGARRHFEHALELDPTYYPAVATLVSIDLAEGKSDQARKRLEAVRQADPSDTRAILALAGLRADAGAPKDEIIGMLADAVRANPSEAAPRLLLIDIQSRSGDVPAALAAAQEGVAALPDNIELRQALARTLIAAGDIHQATIALSKLAELQPQSVEVQLQLSELYIRDKNVAAARQSLKRALALAPTRLETRRRLISLELEDKRPDEAMSIARALQQVPGQQALSLLLVGDIETALKKWDAAEATYRSGLKGPGAGDFAVKIHTLLLISHQDARAEQFRLSWLKEHPNDIPFRTYLGNVALGQKKFDVAEGHYLAVLAVQPENPLVINNLAWAMKQLGKPGALAYAQKANKLYPNQASFMDTLALLLADAGQLPQALEIEKRAVALQPDRGEIRLNLAKLHIKAGQAPAAKAELDRLAKLGNRFPRQAEVSELLKTL